jgi:hypothetical protein
MDSRLLFSDPEVPMYRPWMLMISSTLKATPPTLINSRVFCWTRFLTARNRMAQSPGPHGPSCRFRAVPAGRRPNRGMNPGTRRR